MNIRRFSIEAASEALNDLKSATNVRVSELASATKRLHDEMTAAMKEYKMSVVEELPTWNSVNVPNEDEIPEMSDNRFARCRARLTREKNLCRRMAAQLALASAIRGIVLEKRERIAALEERVNSGACGSEAEVAVAKRRIEHINGIVGALAKRYYAVVGDFLRTRKSVLVCVNAATQRLCDMAPQGDDRVADALRFQNANITRTLEALGANNDKMMRGVAKAATTAFGGRARK